MRKLTPWLVGLVLLGIATMLLLSCTTTTAPKKSTEGGGAFSWILNDLEKGKELAAKESKLILVDFWADW